MLLLDIGNTNIKIYDGKEVRRRVAFAENLPDKPFCYINVNPELEPVLAHRHTATDLAPLFQFSTTYRGMGIDRIAACYTVKNGVVVDAGSAITVDIMKRGHHEGGFILPGIRSCKDSFANISSKLIMDPKKEISLGDLPQNTADALLYATLKSILLMIAFHAKGAPVFVTGGDGARLCQYLPNAVYKENLIFRGMQKVIKETGRSC